MKKISGLAIVAVGAVLLSAMVIAAPQTSIEKGSVAEAPNRMEAYKLATSN